MKVFRDPPRDRRRLRGDEWGDVGPRARGVRRVGRGRGGPRAPPDPEGLVKDGGGGSRSRGSRSGPVDPVGGPLNRDPDR